VAAEANSTLAITDRTLTAVGFVWNQGSLMLSGTGKLVVQGDVTLNGNVNHSLSGGTLEVAVAVLGSNTIDVNAGWFWVNDATLSLRGSDIIIAGNAFLHFSGQCALATAATLKGAGEVVIAAGANLMVQADASFTTTKHSVRGNLTVAASTAVTVTGTGVSLVCEAGARVRTTAGATVGRVVVTTGAALRFAAGAGAAGRAAVDGALIRIQSGGELSLDGQVGVDAGPIDFETGSTLTVDATAGATFAKATLSGALTIAASATMRLTVVESATVTLVTAAGGISGQFGSLYINGQATTSTGRRLLGGRVVYTNTSIEYQGTGSASAAGCLVASILPFVALLW